MRTDFLKGNQGVRRSWVNSNYLRNPLVTIDGERGTKICHQVFLPERMGIEKIHQELMSTLENDAYGLSQMKIWSQRFRPRVLSCMTFLVPDEHPSLCNRRLMLKHFSKGITSQVPA
jgi:hypothetical protein